MPTNTDRRRIDSRDVPAAMRRDVRLLGQILGEVIRESDGQDLLDDVEELRRRVIEARRLDSAAGPHGAAAAGSRRRAGVPGSGDG